MRELPSSSGDTGVSEGSETARDMSLGVSYDEGGEGLGDPSQVAQVRENRQQWFGVLNHTMVTVVTVIARVPGVISDSRWYGWMWWWWWWW